MPWMDVNVRSEVLGGPSFKAYINIDYIVRFNSVSDGSGSTLFLVNGEALRVVDPVEEIMQAVLKAQSK